MLSNHTFIQADCPIVLQQLTTSNTIQVTLIFTAFHQPSLFMYPQSIRPYLQNSLFSSSNFGCFAFMKAFRQIVAYLL